MSLKTLNKSKADVVTYPKELLPETTRRAQDSIMYRRRIFPPKGCFLNRRAEEAGTDTGPSLHSPGQELPSCLEDLEVDVLVTAIDKPNCIWVRDVGNQFLFEDIHLRINEEAVYQKVATEPWDMDKAYMTKEGTWVRCKVVKRSPLTVFFPDYGTVAEVNELRELSEQLAKTPYLANRVTFASDQYIPHLRDLIKIKLSHKTEDGTYFATILEEYRTNSTKPLVQGAENLSLTSGSDNPEEPSLPYAPQYIDQFDSNVREGIVNLIDNRFCIRTEVCLEKLREIEEAIGRYVDTAPSLQDVAVHQLVLFENKSDNRFYRAIVTAVETNRWKVELLDYMEQHTTKTSTVFKAINEELAKQPIPYISLGKLTGFRDAYLDRRMRALISEYRRTRKVTLSLGFNNDQASDAAARPVPHRPKNFPKVPTKILLKNMTSYKPHLGKHTYVVGCYKTSERLTIVPRRALLQHADYLTRAALDDDTPYDAQAEEVCMCFYDDAWYRCAVLQICGEICKVFFLDVGNIEFVAKALLRKADDRIAEVPTLAVSCVLTGLPQHRDLENVLKQELIVGKKYQFDVKSFRKGRYYVEIPHLYRRIRSML